MEIADKPVLKGCIGPLYPSFGFCGVSENEDAAKFSQGSLEL